MSIVTIGAMDRLTRALWFAWILILASPVAFAQDADIPEPLRPWVQWVIDGSPEKARCTWRYDDERIAGCAWPSRLLLELDGRGGTFAQSWTVSSPTWVPLPGDPANWPTAVRAGGETARVADRDGVPSLRLEAGEHDVNGRFDWDSLPARLSVPHASAIVRLTLSGETRANPVRESDGAIVLARSGARSSDEADRVSITVYRRLVDERPFQVHTRLMLDVSGGERELLLPGVFVDGAVPLRLEGPMPIRLLADGRVHLQVRPGRYEFDLYSRLRGRVTTVRRGAIEAPLPPREVWSFDARRPLRDVRPVGLPPVDPRQTRMPDAWRDLPAFAAGEGAELRLEDAPGGEAAPRDQLRLSREWWLDFDGGAFTTRDHLTGIAHADRRLEVDDPVSLGRVVENGEPRLITRLAGTNAHGVEIRPGPLNLVADTRIRTNRAELPVSGWNRDLVEAHATVNLPPGWRLAAVTGADRVRGAWLDRWTTLDMFMVLVLSVAAFRLWGAGAGVVALVALALTWHSAGAPQYAWVPLVVTSALVGVVKPSRLQRFIKTLRFLSIVGLVVVAAPYLVQTARTVVYPQLEHAVPLVPMPMALDDAVRGAFEARDGQAVTMAQEPATLRLKSEASVDMASSGLVPEPAGQAIAAPVPSPPRAADTALIQTGPGVPDWQWNRYDVSWNGPVRPEQVHRLVLLPPWINRGLDTLRFLLVAALAGILIVNRRRRAGTGGAGLAASLAAALLVLPLASGESAVAGEFPPPHLLGELERRVIEPPNCLPHCVNLQSVLVTADEARIRVFYELTALDDVAAPLLAPGPTWSADTVEIDGEAARVLGGGDGALVSLREGHRLVEISGPVGSAREVELSFPMRPHRLVVESSTWRAAGMERPGGDDRQLRLVRDAPAVEAPAGEGEAAAGLVPPYFELTRTLVLDVRARAVSELRRLSDPRAPISLDVPLMPGESPVSAVRVADGEVRASFAAGQSVFRWESVVDLDDTLVLEAPEDAGRVERWQLDAHPRWHVRSRGLSPLNTGGETGPVKTWQPWPGDRLELFVERPDGVAGATMTIDNSRLRITPGRETTRAELTLDLRSSQGGTHTVTLPEAVEVQAVRVDGEVHPVDPEQRAVDVPLRPGTRHVSIEWLQPLAMGVVYRTPEVELGAPSVNHTVEVSPDRSRWLLWLHGPSMGPAILYWGMLVFLLVASMALARVPFVPVASWQWFLLGAGIAHAGLAFALPVVAWFLLAGYRGRLGASTPKARFNLTQVALALLTPLMLWALVDAVQTGLVGSPDMQVAGNHSSASSLAWYQDRTGSLLPQALIVSMPLIAYRALMLAWSLWLALSLFEWLRWSWRVFSDGGTWRAIRWRRKSASSPP